MPRAESRFAATIHRGLWLRRAAAVIDPPAAGVVHEPAKIMTRPQKPSDIRRLRQPFQHHPSNTPDPTAQKRRKTAISGRSTPDGQTASSSRVRSDPRRPPPPSRSSRSAKNAESFAGPRRHHGAGRPIRNRAAISCRPENGGFLPIPARPPAQKLHVQLSPTAFATHKPLIHNIYIEELQSCRKPPSRMCACARALSQARAHMRPLGRGDRCNPQIIQ
jgi:hypothetical protein